MATNQHDADNEDSGKIDWDDCPHVERNPEIMSGAWCFEGTRLPVSALFGNLASGLSIPEFMDHFPNAKLEHINAVLDFLANRLDATGSMNGDDDSAPEVEITIRPRAKTAHT